MQLQIPRAWDTYFPMKLQIPRAWDTYFPMKLKISGRPELFLITDTDMGFPGILLKLQLQMLTVPKVNSEIFSVRMVL